jgi:hypothetical protein
MTGSPADPEAIRAVLRIIVRRTPTMPLEAVLEDVVLRHTVNATHEARRSPRSPAGHVWDVPRLAFLPAVTSRVHQSRRWLRRALANAFDPGSIDRISRDG